MASGGARRLEDEVELDNLPRFGVIQVILALPVPPRPVHLPPSFELVNLGPSQFAPAVQSRDARALDQVAPPPAAQEPRLDKGKGRAGQDNFAFSSSESAVKRREERASQTGVALRNAQKLVARQLLLDRQSQLAERLVKNARTISITARLPVDSFESPLHHVKAIFDAYATNHSREPFPLTSPFAIHLRDESPRILDLLLDLARRGPQFEPQAAVDAGALRYEGRGGVREGEAPVDDAAPEPTRCHLYLRFLRGTVGEQRAWSAAYLAAYPGDAHRERPFLDSVRELAEEAVVGRAYGGESGRKDGMDRAAEDADGGEPWTRYRAFVHVNTLDERLEHYSLVLDHPLWLLATGPVAQATRSHLMLQDGERALVAVISVSSLNSDHGGFFPTFVPSPVLAAAIVSTDESIVALRAAPPRINGIRPRAPLISLELTLETLKGHLQDKIKAHYQLSLDYWQDDPTSGPRMDPRAYELAVTQASSITLAPDGYVTHVRAMKDITEEEFFFKSEFWGPSAGQSPRTLRWILSLVFDLPTERNPRPAVDNLPTPPPLPFGSFFDIWCVILVHKNLIIALVFWIRYLLLARAPIILHSSKLARLLLEGFTVQLIDIGSEGYSPFMACDRTVSPASIVRPIKLPRWHDLPIKDWITCWVGRIVVVQLTEQDWATALLELDTGVCKYDPQSHASLCALIAACELKGRLLVEAAAALRVGTDQASLVALRAFVEKLADDTGVNREIEAAKQEYDTTMGTILALRKYAADERQFEVEKTLEVEAKGVASDVAGETVRVRRFTQQSERMSRTIQASNASHPKAAGAPGSKERRAQLLELELQHLDRSARGLVLESETLAPAGTVVGDAAWSDWLLGVDEETNLQRSAQSTGREHWQHGIDCSPEAVQRFIAANQKPHRRLEWTSPRTVEEALELLDDPSAPRLDLSQGVQFIVHLICGHWTLGNSSSQHRCPAIPTAPAAVVASADLNRGSTHTNMNRKREANFTRLNRDNSSSVLLLFPYQVLDTPAGAIFSPELLPIGWVSESATTILARHSDRMGRDRVVPANLPHVVFRGQRDDHGDLEPSTSTNEQFHLLQALCIFAAESTTAAQNAALCDAGKLHGWADSPRVISLFQLVASLADPSVPRLDRKRVAVAKMRYGTCSKASPCPADSISRSQAPRPTHVASYHGGAAPTDGHNSTDFTFQAFLDLPPHAYARILLATSDIDVGDPAHLAWIALGRPDPFSWTPGSIVDAAARKRADTAVKAQKKEAKSRRGLAASGVASRAKGDVAADVDVDQAEDD